MSQVKPIPFLDFDSSFSALVLGGGLPLVVRELPRKKFLRVDNCQETMFLSLHNCRRWCIICSQLRRKLCFGGKSTINLKDLRP